MVIDEKALIREMRRSYKTGGYIAMRTEEAGALQLSGPDWAVEIKWENVPEKVLGLIVEHLRDLPGVGQGFRVKKGETHTAIYDMADRMPEIDDGAPLLRVIRTPLHYRSFAVWQKIGNNGCLLLREEAADMLLDHGRDVQYRDRGVLLEGNASSAYIIQENTENDETAQQALNLLSEKPWRQ